jgi:hypothetical protein
MWTSDEFRTWLETRGEGDKWDTHVYPGMKKAVEATCKVAQDKVCACARVCVCRMCVCVGGGGGQEEEDVDRRGGLHLPSLLTTTRTRKGSVFSSSLCGCLLHVVLLKPRFTPLFSFPL